jgi:hypothetical protein
MDEDFELQGKKYVIAEYPHGERDASRARDASLAPQAVVPYRNVLQDACASTLLRVCEHMLGVAWG